MECKPIVDKKKPLKRFMPDSQAVPYKQGKRVFAYHRKPSKGPKKLELGDNLCMSRPSLYKDVIGAKHIAIRNVHPLTLEQNNQVHKALIQEIAKMEKGCGPSFLEIAYKDNCIAVVCADQSSHDWLADIIPKIKPWPEAELSIMPDDLPPQIASIYVAQNVAETTEDALKLLQVQNQGLKTERWKVLIENIQPKGRVITFSLDQESVDALKLKGYRASIGLTQTHFKFKVYR